MTLSTKNVKTITTVSASTFGCRLDPADVIGFIAAWQIASLQLTWSAPLLPNGVITAYEVSHQLQGGTELGRVNTTDVRTTHTLTGLRPQTTYTVTVKAYTIAGSGKEREGSLVLHVLSVSVYMMIHTDTEVLYLSVWQNVSYPAGYIILYSPLSHENNTPLNHYLCWSLVCLPGWSTSFKCRQWGRSMGRYSWERSQTSQVSRFVWKHINFVEWHNYMNEL